MSERDRCTKKNPNPDASTGHRVERVEVLVSGRSVWQCIQCGLALVEPR